MADQFYFVKWKAGEIRVHASSAAQAIKVALQYITQPDRNIFATHPLPTIEDKDKDKDNA